MSSPEVERFEITDEDLISELHGPKRFKHSKKRAMLGIWAGSSDEDEKPKFNKGRKNKTDYTKQLNFVSGGVKVGDKMVSEKDDSVDENSSENDVQAGDTVRSFYPEGMTKKKTKKGPWLNKIGEDKSMGSWEKHTKGIGAKLLAQMGYQPGQGLGVNNQGITIPVAATVRKGRAAVGAYGTERSERSLIDYPVKDSDEEEDQRFQEELSQWKRSEKAGSQKVKYKYKTADEVIAAGKRGSRKRQDVGDAAKVKVIDLTGREKKVFSGYQALGARHEQPAEVKEAAATPHQPAPAQPAFDLPELQHNLDLLVDTAEDDIVNNDRELRHAEDRVVSLEYEREQLEDLCEKEQQQLQRVQKLLAILESCEQRTKPGAENPLLLSEAVGVFRKLQDEFPEEYRMHCLSSLAGTMLAPQLRAELSYWAPLERPGAPLALMRSLQEMSGESTGAEDWQDMSAYERLVWDVWMPRVRNAISKWSPRSPDRAIELMESWHSLLPEWMYGNVRDQLLLPRLQNEVENWNPLTDHMPIHAWLHPWLPIMKDRLEPLYAPIRHKLANALTKWHPSDASAKLILQPWKEVFRAGHMDSFLVRHIVPKLELCLREMPINPHHQNLDAWNWVMSWRDMISPIQMAGILDRSFFPGWLQVLSSWLNARPNYLEVSNWFSGWKSQVSKDILEQPSIKQSFNRALDMMHRAVDGQPSMPLPPPPPPREPGPMYSERRFSPQPPIAVQQHSASVPQTFKDIVHRKAEENGIIFVPISGRTYQGHQVYKFGNVNVYIERSVLFLQEGQLWLPMAVDALVRRAL